MKPMLGAFLLLTTAALPACTPAPFVSPAHGGPTWTKLTTSHFTVYTDMPVEEAKPVAHDLQEAYGVLQDLAFPYEKKPAGHLDVVLFHHEDAFRQMADNADQRAFFQRETHDPDGRPMIVLYRGLDASVRTIVQHELVHRFVAFYFPGAPRWLNEGLATFYETMMLGNGQARIGYPPSAWPFGRSSAILFATDYGVTDLSRSELPPVSSVVFLDRGHFDPGGSSIASSKLRALHYAAAWNLVHTMYFGPPPLPATFDAYLVALSAGGEPHDAWNSALQSHGVSAERLELEYQQHADRHLTRYGVTSYNPDESRVALHAQPMTETEVRLLWARVRYWRGEDMARVGTDLAAALEANPDDSEARALRGQWLAALGRGDEALAEMRRAVALDPKDYRPSYVLASFLDFLVDEKGDPSGELRNELRGLVDGLRDNAGSAQAWNFIARYDSDRAEPERGLAFARKAVVADSSCFDCYDTAALLLLQSGKIKDAIAAERIAVQLVPDGVSRQDMVDRLQFLRENGAELTSEMIVSIVRLRVRIRGCYVDALRKNPDTEGKGRLLAKLGPGGEVLSVTMKNSKGLDEELLGCLVRAVQKTAFPPPKDGNSTVIIPINLMLQR